MATVGVIVWKSDLFRRPAAAGIAVLPFENLSNDREDASFADGVQDDLLTKLAKIAALKVISRTSVMEFRGKHNTRQIGDELGASHVLEGSVRKTGAWLHINAQLIDARTDSHVWAEEYDRDLKDTFAVQSEIAQKVAERLHAKISPAERQAIERPPTADLAAFDLYSRAKNPILTWNSSSTEKGYLLQAANLLNQAVAHDPTFFQAYCQLAWVHDHLYFYRFDRTSERLALAKAAIEAASRLRPDAGEAHLARAQHLYEDTSIMMEPWPNWELLTKACPMTLGYSHSRVTLSVTARAVIKKRRYAISSAQLSSTHATASCCGRSPLAITIFGAIRRKKELWIASWRSGQMTSI